MPELVIVPAFIFVYTRIQKKLPLKDESKNLDVFTTE